MLHHSSLEIHQREDQGIVILDLHGELEMGNGDVALREFVENLLGQGKRTLILDLAHVSAIDTAGSSVLLFLAQQYQAAGGRLALFKLDPIHAKIYELARLETAIEIYPDELDAVNSFFPDRKLPHYDILDYIDSQKTPNDQT
ncbi:MAG TPA: STAS domain-containing protein [Bryobacteraceae bacterium]|jgi:anti-sigma B factor antagonist|nr:STAS domain-containing protein [Bryobacteraceae bacterium]